MTGIQKKADGTADIDNGPKLAAMKLPVGLDKEQRLNCVIGSVTRQAAMAEDATFSVLRTLNEDFSLATGQQKMPVMSRVIGLCIDRYEHDWRLAEMKDDAIGLLRRVKQSADKRNELVHSLWSVSDDPIETRYKTLEEIELSAKGTSNVGTDTGPTIDDLPAVHNDLLAQQTSLNFLKFRTIYAFNSYRNHNLRLPDPNAVEWYNKVVRGEFDVTETGFALGSGVRREALDRALSHRCSSLADRIFDAWAV